MPSVEFVYRSYDPNGVARATASRVVESLQTTGHLGEVAESLYQTLSQQPAESRMVLSVEEEPPVAIEYAPLSPGLGVGQLIRGPLAAFVIILGLNARLVEPDLQKLQEKLQQAYPQAQPEALFAWLKTARPPVAAGMYVQAGPADVGLDTVAVALAGAVFRRAREDPGQ